MDSNHPEPRFLSGTRFTLRGGAAPFPNSGFRVFASIRSINLDELY
jgi:hypothetical protein